MYYYGYTRCSTKEQDTKRGEAEIQKYCDDNGIVPERIITDHISGRTFNRDGWNALKNYMLRRGDVLITTEIDRLGRTKADILKELRDLKDKGILIRILELPTTLIDYSSFPDELGKLMMETINNMLIEMYASFAEAEMHKKVKRQREGIEQMKARGEWDRYGRKRVMTAESFKKEYARVQAGELRNCDLMRELKMSASTFYRYVQEIKKNKE